MKNKRENGSALVAVLALLFTGGILTTLMIDLSKRYTFDITSHTQMQRSMLIAEGVANRAQWLLAADCEVYGAETLGETDYEEYESDRYMADAVPHLINYHGEMVRLTIYDAISGYDFSANQYSNTLSDLAKGRSDDAGYNDYLKRLKIRIADYTDSNSEPGEDGGLEEDNYDEMGMYPLPRNGEMQFREELLYIPGFRKLFPTDRHGRMSQIRLIPYEGYANLSGTPSIFSADRLGLKAYGEFEDDEIDEILNCLRLWRNEKTMLSESMDEELYARLTKYAKTESGFYTFIVESPEGELQRPFKRLAVTIANSGIAGPEDQIFHYMEWFFH